MEGLEKMEQEMANLMEEMLTLVENTNKENEDK